MERHTLISIITATYNAGEVLEDSIKSVLSQNYSNIEYIIIDGGSTDNTLNIINKYKESISYWISEPDCGIYDAWNKGIRLAKGDWIAFLGADDIYVPDAISSYVKLINCSNENTEFISSRVELIDLNKNKLRVIGKQWNWADFKIYMSVAHVGSMHSKRLFKKYGNYDLDFKIVGDYEMLLRSKGELRARYLDQVTVKMQLGGVSNQSSGVLKEVFKAKLKLGIRNYWLASYDMFFAYFKYFIRNALLRH